MSSTNLKRKKIAIVCRTVGLEFDDRIRKECISLSKFADLEIFVNFTSNKQETGITSYGIPYRSFNLTSRDKLKSGNFLFLKAFEFYLKVKPYLNDFDLFWVHEEYTFIFPLLIPSQKVIWDLHEIPKHFYNPVMRKIFHIIEKRCFKLIHANDYRIDYLKTVGIILDNDKHISLRNYPDSVFENSTMVPAIFEKVKSWLNSDDYVYIQGLSLPDRYPVQTISALLDYSTLKVVVIGNVDKNAKLELSKKYGDLIEERILFLGMVNQLEITVLLKSALFSIVLYNTDKPNNRFCEPNRLYQSLIMSIPVIVGCNETMKEIVEKYDVGIVLQGDGRDIVELGNAILDIQSKIEYFKSNSQLIRNLFFWNYNLLNIINPVDE